MIPGFITQAWIIVRFLAKTFNILHHWKSTFLNGLSSIFSHHSISSGGSLIHERNLKTFVNFQLYLQFSALSVSTVPLTQHCPGQRLAQISVVREIDQTYSTFYGTVISLTKRFPGHHSICNFYVY